MERRFENEHCEICECPFKHPKKYMYFADFSNCKFGTFFKFFHDVTEEKKNSEEDMILADVPSIEIGVTKQEEDTLDEEVNENDDSMFTGIDGGLVKGLNDDDDTDDDDDKDGLTKVEIFSDGGCI